MACKYKNRVWDNGWCNVACMYCTLTQESTCKHNHQTNADWIRAMSDEELAKILGDKCICPPVGKCVGVLAEIGACSKCWLQWLQQPTDD